MQRSLRLLSIVVLLALPALAGAGCASPSSPGNSRWLSSAQFDDVPVRGGFLMDTSPGKSWSYAEGGSGAGSFRLGRLLYEGREEPGPLLAWYETEMLRPIHGWPPGTRLDENTLLFVRGGERVLILVERVGEITRLVVERNTRSAREAGR